MAKRKDLTGNLNCRFNFAVSEEEKNFVAIAISKTGFSEAEILRGIIGTGIQRLQSLLDSVGNDWSQLRISDLKNIKGEKE